MAQLSPNFAQELLDLQQQIHTFCQLSTIKSLMRLYSVKFIQQAIEYYSSLDDLRQFHYQSRLRSLFSRPEVLRVIEGFQPRRRSLEVQKRELAQRNHQISQQLTFQIPPSMMSRRHLQKTIKGHLQQSQSTTQMLRESLVQQDRIEDRIEARKRSRSQHKPTKSLIDRFDAFREQAERINEKYSELKLNFMMHPNEISLSFLQRQKDEELEVARNLIRN